ncbi:polymorphic toxin-type HINT domain-containing protein [Brevibacillus formosus]|uniref:polymorphic toxin-type HINT domain-containing protein n=1 Tax=Brevibacillus formosus TaxID=54913 RepID=UPI002155DA93|nr:polymorphic toxin-type HINT domain-containing protein [Brevibacillus formosus]
MEDTYKGQVDNPLSLNRYTYVLNNPLIFIDPTGHAEVSFGAIWFGMTKAGKELPGAVEKAGKELPGAVKKAGVEYVGVDNVNTLTDGNWNSDDVFAAGNVTINIIPAGKLVKTAKAETKAAVKVLKGCDCFTAGTKVLTAEGEKNIEDIQVGDKVLSKNEETGERAYKEVTATFNHETDVIYQIHVGGQTIESTFNHPFYVKDKGWTYVKDLKVGDLLVQSDGNTLRIESIALLQKQVTVYNMTVDEFHTYFVSDLGIWVHNTNCPWKTIVEEKNVTSQLKSLSAKQQESFESIKTQLASGDTAGLNVHALTGNKKGLMSADFKGFGQGRGNARIYYKVEDGKITITEIDLKHQK